MKNNIKEKITVICYDKERVFNSRKKAIEFYTECYYSSDGSEKERYSNILCDLQSDKIVCKDEYNEFDYIIYE